MKIEIGQWVRDRYGNIFSVLDVYQNEYYCLVNETLEGVDFKSIIKVANTPQELIQVGDLVKFYHSFKVEVVGIKKNLLRVSSGSWHFMEEIIELYTPNEDKSVYTLQYKKEMK
ncbi:MAG: hypothetical protein KAU90_08345 [Sulfurovaceae bacterium]|nr:hypothetical protein [Sulfurovaceae bacterium]